MKIPGHERKRCIQQEPDPSMAMHLTTGTIQHKKSLKMVWMFGEATRHAIMMK